jgi:hypothetical protein
VELPSILASMHNVVHISQLKKCLKPSTDVIVEGIILLELDLTYKAYPVRFWNNRTESPEGRLLDSIKSSGTIIRKMKRLGNARTISDLISRIFYPRGKPASVPRIFIPYLESRGEISFKGESCNTSYYGNLDRVT